MRWTTDAASSRIGCMQGWRRAWRWDCLAICDLGVRYEHVAGVQDGSLKLPSRFCIPAITASS